MSHLKQHLMLMLILFVGNGTMGHVHSNNDFAEDPGLDFTIGAVGLVQL
jgi:hypothetical protein